MGGAVGSPVILCDTQKQDPVRFVFILCEEEVKIANTILYIS